MRLFFICIVLLGIGWELSNIHSALDKIADNTKTVQNPVTNSQSAPLQDSVNVPVYIMDSNGIHLK